MMFRDWLDGQMGRQGVSRRELARRLAAKHPAGVNPQTLETYRRSIRRYLSDTPVIPNEQTRTAIADALGVDPYEEDDDPFADLMREVVRLRDKYRQFEIQAELPRTLVPGVRYEDESRTRLAAALGRYQEVQS